MMTFLFHSVSHPSSENLVGIILSLNYHTVQFRLIIWDSRPQPKLIISCYSNQYVDCNRIEEDSFFYLQQLNQLNSDYSRVYYFTLHKTIYCILHYFVAVVWYFTGIIDSAWHHTLLQTSVVTLYSYTTYILYVNCILSAYW